MKQIIIVSSVFLFYPWRNEREQIEDANCKELYKANVNTILENGKKFNVLSDEQAEKIFELINQPNEPDDEDEVDEILREFIGEDNDEQEHIVDLFEQVGAVVGKPKDKKSLENRYFSPQKFPKDQVLEMLEPLNERQRMIVMHIYKSFVANKGLPLRIFLGGSAGVGKSKVIDSLYQLLSHHFDNQPGEVTDTIKVLLTAFAGKAAFLINGTTLHTAFALPVNQSAHIPELSADIANTIRAQLRDLKVLIIDEISMVGARTLDRVNQRLIQIMGKNESFGGISVIFVGDLNQLPPVFDKAVYDAPEDDDLKFLAGPVLFDEFRYFELTQIMRQKDEKDFIEALNNIAIGNMTAKDIELIETRVKDEKEVPQEAIRLYSTNEEVNKFNDRRIKQRKGLLNIVLSKESFTGKITAATKKKLQSVYANKPLQQTGGLSGRVSLKVGIKYMITTNIDVEDGLVNGACGVLRHIHFASLSDPKPIVLFIEFAAKNVGVKARRQNAQLLQQYENEDFSKICVPIRKVSKPLQAPLKSAYQVFREQFPVTVAEAITIHKSQGQTYDSVCVNMHGLTRQKMYVAFSRVTNLSGLYILGKFKAPKPPKVDDKAMNAIKKLKTEKKLELVFNDLSTKTGPVIAYHNVRSFAKHSNHIKNDYWYSKCDILILSETRTMQATHVNLPNFYPIYRLNAVRQAPGQGLLILARNEFQQSKHIESLQNKFFQDRKGHLMLSLLRIDEYYLITGYKSPNFPTEKFLSNLESFMAEHMKNRTAGTKIIMMGDFNLDADVLKKQLSKKKILASFDSKLSPNEQTMLNNTNALDIVFANFSELITGVYCSYFSDHMPIFCMLNKHEIPLELFSQWSQPKMEVEECSVVKEKKTNKEPVKSEYWLRRSKLPGGYENPITTEVKPPSSKIPRLLSSPKKTSDAKRIKTSRKFKSKLPVRVVTPKSPPILIPSGDLEQPAVDNNEIILMKRIETQLSSNRECVSDDVIDRFIKIVNNEAWFSVLCYQVLEFEHYEDRSQSGLDDIQIIFKKPPEGSDIGHYVCVYFNYAEDCVYVYDSLYFDNLDDRQKEILGVLYPGKRVKHMRPLTRQPDGTSCGVMAIAYATMLMNGRRPENTALQIDRVNRTTMPLRSHLKRILLEREIMEFPYAW